MVKRTEDMNRQRYSERIKDRSNLSNLPAALDKRCPEFFVSDSEKIEGGKRRAVRLESFRVPDDVRMVWWL